jgi:hypothetical protein
VSDYSFNFEVSRGRIRFASRVSVRFDSESPDVGAGSFLFVIDLEPPADHEVRP